MKKRILVDIKTMMRKNKMLREMKKDYENNKKNIFYDSSKSDADDKSF